MRKLLPAAIVAALVSLIPLSAAHAVTYGVRIFISAPNVQGSPLTSDRTVENFDSAPLGTCPTTITEGTISGECEVYEPLEYGGASSELSTPVTGGTGTRFPATDQSGVNEITITLNTPQKYLGFWWSAGNPGNTVEFFSNGELVASMDTQRIIDKLSDTNQVSVGGSTYASADYYGNPVDGENTIEAYLFLSLYAQGGTSFDKVILSGNGFEFDNLTTSALEVDPADELVEVAFIEGLVEPEGYSDNSSASGSSGSLAKTGFDTTSALFAGSFLVAAGGMLSLRRRRRG